MIPLVEVVCFSRGLAVPVSQSRRKESMRGIDFAFSRVESVCPFSRLVVPVFQSRRKERQGALKKP